MIDFQKIRKKLKREVLKRDEKWFRKFVERYELELLHKDKNGVIFDIDLKDNMRFLISSNRYMDGNVSKILERFSGQQFHNSFDVGANFGLCSVMLSKFSKVVHSFEPDQGNIDRMKKIFHFNQVDNVQIQKLAVSEKPGKERFYISPGSAHHSLALAHENQTLENFIDVDVVSLDSYTSDKKISHIECLKVDVEGLELEVLKGAKDLLKNKKVDNLIFEISTGVMERLDRDPLEGFVEIEKHNYKVFDSFGKQVTSKDVDVKVSGQDYLAIPK